MFNIKNWNKTRRCFCKKKRMQQQIYSHDELVRAALTTLQMSAGRGVWLPPKEARELVYDMFNRFCGCPPEKAEKLTNIAMRRLSTRIELWVLDMRELTRGFGLTSKEAYSFVRAAQDVDLVMHLESLPGSVLLDIIQGK
jgi:hypothetical protein